MNEWRMVPLRAIYQRIELRGRADLPLLSVYRDHGVVLRDERDDNNNRPSEDLSTYKHVRPGDLVVNKMKTWQGSLAVSGYEGIVSPAYFVGRRVAEADNRYMHHLLRSLPLIAEYAARSKGIRPSQWDLPWDEFASIKVALPEAGKQRAIADYLDTETARIDALIARKQQLVEVVSEYFVALLSTTMGSLPSRRRLRQLAKLGTGHTPDRKKPEYWLDCTIPWVTAADLSSRDDVFEPLLDTEQKVSEMGVANSAAVVHPQGTVMLCRTASIGLLCEIGVPMATTQAFVTWTPGPNLDSTFLLFALSSMAQEWKRLAFGSTHDTIYMPDLESVKIPFASLDEQRRIAARLKDASTEVGKIRKKLNDQIGLLRECRQALITAAVTGELDVPGVAA